MGGKRGNDSTLEAMRKPTFAPCPRGAHCGGHRGVQFKQRWRGSRLYYEMSWRVPVGKGKYRYGSEMDSRGLATAAARHSQALAKRKELDADRARRRGLPVRGLSVDQAVADFVTTLTGEGKEAASVDTFRRRILPLQEWARDRVRTTDDLTLVHVEDFRRHVLGLTRRRKHKGTDRKARGVPTGKPLGGGHKKSLLSCSLRFLREYARHLPDREVVRTLDIKRIDPGQREVHLLRDVAEIRQALKAAMDVDADPTRAEWWALNARTPPPVAAIVLLQLLCGLRPHELSKLAWPSAVAQDGEPLARVNRAANGGKGALEIPRWNRTKPAHSTGLDVSPAARELLKRLQLRAGGSGFVFGPFPRLYVLKRLRRAGAPASFSWEAVRHTTQSVQFAAPHVIPQVAACFRLGHSMATAAKHYVGRFPDVPTTVPNPKAGTKGEPDTLPMTTLEQAMGIEDLAREIIAAVNVKQPAAGVGA